MSNPRPDPPRLAAIRELWNAANGGDQLAWGMLADTPLATLDVVFAERDALLADLRTLEAQWREGIHNIRPDYKPSHRHLCTWCRALFTAADDLAALLARLEA